MSAPLALHPDAILSHLLLVAGDERNSKELRLTAEQLALEWRQCLAITENPQIH